MVPMHNFNRNKTWSTIWICYWLCLRGGTLYSSPRPIWWLEVLHYLWTHALVLRVIMKIFQNILDSPRWSYKTIKYLPYGTCISWSLAIFKFSDVCHIHDWSWNGLLIYWLIIQLRLHNYFTSTDSSKSVPNNYVLNYCIISFYAYDWSVEGLSQTA